jgi:hypothetical protein
MAEDPATNYLRDLADKALVISQDLDLATALLWAAQVIDDCRCKDELKRADGC